MKKRVFPLVILAILSGLTAPAIADFVDNGDGTITDGNTGLMWAKNASLSGAMDWAYANYYIQNVFNGYAGYEDWRLPSSDELLGLHNKGINADDPPGPFENICYFYWTSTEDGEGSAFVRKMYKNDGSQFSADKSTYSYYAWPVRGTGARTVTIDIKPGSDPNCINNDGKGVIPVAILGSADLDVTQIDASTVKLEGSTVKVTGKSDKLLAHIEDVNNDSYDDLVVQIQDEDGIFELGEATAEVTGTLLDGGGGFRGEDSICIVPPDGVAKPAAPPADPSTWGRVKSLLK